MQSTSTNVHSTFLNVNRHIDKWTYRTTQIHLCVHVCVHAHMCVCMHVFSHCGIWSILHSGALQSFWSRSISKREDPSSLANIKKWQNWALTRALKSSVTSVCLVQWGTVVCVCVYSFKGNEIWSSVGGGVDLLPHSAFSLWAPVAAFHQVPQWCLCNMPCLRNGCPRVHLWTRSPARAHTFLHCIWSENLRLD